MKERWLKFLADSSKYIDQKSCLVKLCKYVFAIPDHHANMERIFSLMSTQGSDEQNGLRVETVEAVLTCHYNFKMTGAEFYNYVKEENDIIKKVKSTLKYDWAEKDKPRIYFVYSEC
ncbi:hypothetical protein AVEN_17903-1 [Araneus ventricosus]|uniref:HAT C-terminal dimerisation domain-containing protein n=1 Tax=Araneus ventricosus TaxID=182803 RepID=A0A4Y2Q4M8_ARAVE|nr:hypothetical protein AVEN_17903-1 [Araneus ventricosus]